MIKIRWHGRHTDTSPWPSSHAPRGFLHVFAGHVNTQHATDGPHLGAQPLFVRVGNECSHAAWWLNQRDMAPELGVWCRIKLGREGVLCHNFSRSSLQPILGGGCLRPARRHCHLRPYSIPTSAPLSLRPIGFPSYISRIFLHLFLQLITYLPAHIPVLSGSCGSAYHRHCRRPHHKGANPHRNLATGYES